MMINEAKIQELIRRHKETGLTISAFCTNEGIPKSSFYYWRKRLRHKCGKNFIPLMVSTTSSSMMDQTHTNSNPRNEDHLPSGDFLLELCYPNGTRLRIKSNPDLDNLRSLVRLID